MAKVTQRDLVDTITGLRVTAGDLKTLAQQPPLANMPGVVLAKTTGLLEIAQYLLTVADELLTLIPDKVIPTPPKE
jgi:hypothetical protein